MDAVLEEETEASVVEETVATVEDDLRAGAKSCIDCGATGVPIVNGKCGACPDCPDECFNIEPPYCHCLGWRHTDGGFDRKTTSPDQYLCQECLEYEQAEAAMEEAQATVPQGE